MFAATLIVFRESLEAALFVGIVAAATRQLHGRHRFLGAGVGLGVAGALLLAALAPRISGWFDGLGQDAVNIGVLSIALAMLLWHCIWVAAHSREMVGEARRLGASVEQGQRTPWALVVAVALAVLREGAETVLFVGGSMTAASDSNPGAVFVSGALGLALGVAAGALIYGGLARMSTRHIFTATNALIALLAGSIASQLMKSMAQAGIFETWTTPLWDTSRLLAPDSVVGTFLHALVGYDARPSGAQLAAYLGALVLIYAGTRFMRGTTATTASS